MRKSQLTTHHLLEVFLALSLALDLLHAVDHLLEDVLLCVVDVSVGSQLKSLKEFLLNHDFRLGRDFGLRLSDLLPPLGFLVHNRYFSSRLSVQTRIFGP